MRQDPTVVEDTLWYFSQDPEGRWRWGAVSGDGAVIVRSAERFPDRANTVENAAAYGYAAGKTGNPG